MNLGYGSGGIILLLIETFFIYQILSYYEIHKNLSKISKAFIFLFIFHIAYLFLEFFLRLNGYEYLFVDLFGNAENVTKFKDYNSAPYVIHSLGIKGLNSSILGSQIAGTLSLLSLVFFIGKRYFLNDKSNFTFVLMVLSFITYSFCMTQTTNLLLLIAFIFLFFYFPKFIGLNSKLFKFLFFLSFIIIFLLFSRYIIYELIFFKFNEQKDIIIYLNLFLDPLREFLNLDFNTLAFGIGRASWNYDATTDLGFFAIIFRVGVPYFLIINIFFLYLIIKSIRKINKINENNYLSFYILLNCLFVSIYWGSLIHYTAALELGARELFAFNIAFLLQLLRVRDQSQINRDVL